MTKNKKIIDKNKEERNKGMEGLGQILLKYNLDDSKKRRYISREFQDFGYKLAIELGDEKNVGMYMRIAKNEDRTVLEEALSFVKDAKNAKSKARLFLWKMKKIKQGN